VLVADIIVIFSSRPGFRLISLKNEMHKCKEFERLNRVFTTLENMEISGNSFILENSVNLKYSPAVFVYQLLFFHCAI